jgi:hypothetical protein
MIRNTYEGRGTRRFGRPDQVYRGIKTKGSVLEVEIHEIETGSGCHFHHIRGVGLNTNP